MKSKHPLSWLFILISACWLLLVNQTVQAAPELTIGNYQLVSSKRISRTVFEYTYKASITNTGIDAIGVTASLSIDLPGITVLDNNLEFGDVQSGATIKSTDNFIVRQDRQYSFNINDLKWNTQTRNLPFSIPPDPENVISDPDGGIYPINQILVSLTVEANREDAEEIAQNIGAKVIGYFPSINMYQLQIAAKSIEELQLLITTLELDIRVEFALTNNSVEFNDLNTDIGNLRESNPSYTIAYDNIKIVDAWQVINKYNPSLTPVSVGIVDTGIDAAHNEFNGVTLNTGVVNRDNGSNYPICASDGTLSSISVSSHGTQVAGIVGANNISSISSYSFPQMNGILAGNQGLDYSLITRPMSQEKIKKGIFFDKTYNSDIFEQIEEVLLQKPKPNIVNFSFGISDCNGFPDDANQCQRDLVCTQNIIFEKYKKIYKKLFNAHKQDVLFVASAGNGYSKNNGALSGLNAIYHLPGGGFTAENLITIGAATTANTAIGTNFSNYGPTVDITAPGENVYAPGVFVDSVDPLNPTNYQTKFTNADGDVLEVRNYFSGTSASAPMVTGVAGLIKSIRGDSILPTQIKQILKQSADSSFLEGRHLNALAAVCHPDVLNCQSLSNFQFTDSNLTDCINSQNWQYVEQATNLSCSSKTITNLAGIENLKSLRILDLSNNNITDLSTLMGLTQLEQLNLSGNSNLLCADVTALEAALTNTAITKSELCVSQNGILALPFKPLNALPTVTQDYACHGDSCYVTAKYHTGVDFVPIAAVNSGIDNTVYAAGAGEIVQVAAECKDTGDSSCNHGFGNSIIIKHREDLFTLYAHFKAGSVLKDKARCTPTVTDDCIWKIGDNVNINEKLAEMGQTGEVTGPHFHFEVNNNGGFGVFGYAATHPNNHGYKDPWAYFAITAMEPTPVKITNATGVNVRRDPSTNNSALLELSTGQRFVAFAKYGTGNDVWYRIHLPCGNSHSCAGWIAGKYAGVTYSELQPTNTQLEIAGTGVSGVRVRDIPNGQVLNTLYDTQRFVYSETTPAVSGDGCNSDWHKVDLPLATSSATNGWVCGDYISGGTPPLQTGLVAYYPLDGSANDASGHGNNGTPVGGATLIADRFGNANSAYDLAGANDYIEVPSSNTLNFSGDFSVSMWVFVDSYNYGTVLISKGWADSGPFYLQFDGNNNQFVGRLFTENGTAILNSDVKRPLDGKWHHYAMTFTSGIQKLYFDGVLKATTTLTGTLVSSDFPMRIGSMTNRNYGLDGKIDDVRIYNRALAESEILELGRPLNNTPTVKLNDTGITTCSNANSNGLACPVAGFPGQDAQFGRDIYAANNFILQKVGGGNGGFDFTKLDSNGNPLPASATAWDCVKDNFTGLIWEVKTTSGSRSMFNTYTWYEPDNTKNGGDPGLQNGGTCTGSNCDTQGYVQAVNAQGLCGANNWRMPKRNELLSIVDNSRINPAIDSSYFPNTPSTSYVWSSSPDANNSNSAWNVYFYFGYIDVPNKTYPSGVRLVRGGQ